MELLESLRYLKRSLTEPVGDRWLHRATVSLRRIHSLEYPTQDLCFFKVGLLNNCLTLQLLVQQPIRRRVQPSLPRLIERLEEQRVARLPRRHFVEHTFG